MKQEQRPFSLTGEDGKNHKLTLKQKLFCEKYVKFRGNGTKAVKAAGYEAKSSNMGAVVAYENLKKPHISAYIETLLRSAGLTDVAVDLALLEVIQQNANIPVKVQGIREYNRMRGRHSPEKVESEIRVIEVGWGVEKGDRDRD